MSQRSAKQRRVLDPVRIVLTLEQLQARIEERFPHAGLAVVCADLAETARKTAQRTRDLGRPYLGLRALTVLVAVVALALQVYAASLVNWTSIEHKADAVSLTQGLESAVNLGLLAFGAIFFLGRWETRLKRARTLRHLYELRAFAHVIDMHQLTKDPSVILGGVRTASSPQRPMNEFQLARYLDYCSEMLALTSKLAALYASRSRDSEVVDAVNDVEVLTSDLGRKIWQKITILSQLKEVDAEGPAPVEG
jgi:hypothetical protein